MTPDSYAKLRRCLRRAAAPLLIVAFFALSIDDWSRDFIAYEAEIGLDARGGDPPPIQSDRPVAHLVEAAKWAALRIRGWEYVGTAGGGGETLVSFVRTSRILRVRDDVTVHIRELGDRRVVTATSRSRTAIGDLGRNPRNLRKLFQEMDAVLGNAARVPAPFSADAE